MKTQITVNVAVFMTLLAVPLVAMYAAAEQGRGAAVGFSMLLYEPFDFAYVLLAWLLFFGVNCSFLVPRRRDRAGSVGVALATSAVVVAAWFVVSFLAVGQLHLSLGGKL